MRRRGGRVLGVDPMNEAAVAQAGVVGVVGRQHGLRERVRSVVLVDRHEGVGCRSRRKNGHDLQGRHGGLVAREGELVSSGPGVALRPGVLDEDVALGRERVRGVGLTGAHERRGEESDVLGEDRGIRGNQQAAVGGLAQREEWHGVRGCRGDGAGLEDGNRTRRLGGVGLNGGDLLIGEVELCDRGGDDRDGNHHHQGGEQGCLHQAAETRILHAVLSSSSWCSAL